MGAWGYAALWKTHKFARGTFYLNFTERKFHLIFIIAPLSGVSVERAMWIS